MINTITTLSNNDEFINICELEAGKQYKVSFKFDGNACFPFVHIHEEDGHCLEVMPINGNNTLPNKKYTYPVKSPVNGFLAIKLRANVNMYDIKVEEVLA